jgi:hypothetical protein
MSLNKFHELMRRAKAIPYRVGGRVRVAFTEGTPDLVLNRTKECVAEFADRIAEELTEPDGPTKKQWRKAGLRQLDVCEEPCPEGVNLSECDVAWLIERCRRYHFTLRLTEQGTLAFTPDEGWKMEDEVTPAGVRSGIKSVMPSWFAETCKRRKIEIILHLQANGEKG